MKKYITAALMLFTITMSHAQNNGADTSTLLSVHNTGARFKMIPADFGTRVTQDLIGVMVRSYDTVMVLKENGGADTTGRKPIRYFTERRCDVMSQNISGKVVVMELNKDCDVTQTCLNVQKAGAKAFVIIHNANGQGNIKLPKKGLFKDSIRIPIFTVNNNVGDSITLLLPTVVGIRIPAPLPPPQNRITNDSVLTTVFLTKTPENTEGGNSVGQNGTATTESLTNETGLSKQGFTISPNPTRNQTNITYQFLKATDVTIEVKAASGQVIFSKILRGVTVGTVEIPTVDYPNGTYFVSLQYGKEVKTQKLIVRH